MDFLDKYDDISDDEFRMYQIFLNEDITDREVRNKILQKWNYGYNNQVPQDDSTTEDSDSEADEDLLSMDGSNILSYVLYRLKNHLKNLESTLTDLQKQRFNTQKKYEDTMAQIKWRRREVKRLRAEAKRIESVEQSMKLGTYNYFDTDDEAGTVSSKKEKVEKESQSSKRSDDNTDSGENKMIKYASAKEYLLKKYAEYSKMYDLSEDTSSSEPSAEEMPTTNKVVKKYLHRKCKAKNTADDILKDKCSSEDVKKENNKVVKNELYRKIQLLKSEDVKQENNKVVKNELYRKIQLLKSAEDTRSSSSSKPKKRKAANKVGKYQLRRKYNVHDNRTSEDTCTREYKGKKKNDNNQ